MKQGIAPPHSEAIVIPAPATNFFFEEKRKDSAVLFGVPVLVLVLVPKSWCWCRHHDCFRVAPTRVARMRMRTRPWSTFAMLLGRSLPASLDRSIVGHKSASALAARSLSARFEAHKRFGPVGVAKGWPAQAQVCAKT